MRLSLFISKNLGDRANSSLSPEKVLKKILLKIEINVFLANGKRAVVVSFGLLKFSEDWGDSHNLKNRKAIQRFKRMTCLGKSSLSQFPQKILNLKNQLFPFFINNNFAIFKDFSCKNFLCQWILN